MSNDPITDEMRAIWHAPAAQFGNDISQRITQDDADRASIGRSHTP